MARSRAATPGMAAERGGVLRRERRLQPGDALPEVRVEGVEGRRDAIRADQVRELAQHAVVEAIGSCDLVAANHAMSNRKRRKLAAPRPGDRKEM